jgi:hypothetical protein
MISLPAFFFRVETHGRTPPVALQSAISPICTWSGNAVGFA